MAETRGRSIRIVLLDDHALFRESVARLLSSDRDFEIVASCGSIDEALAALRGARIDLVLLDFDLGQRDGAKFLRSAHAQGYAGKVLVVTAGVDRHEAVELIRSGVSGIFTKHNSAALLAEGIRDVMSGKVWFDQELLREAVGEDKPRSEDEAGRFTERERLVLSFVFEGLANKQIAERIKVSESSVKATLQQLFAKTGVRTRSQLVRVALEQQKEQQKNDTRNA
jgi:two-component system, NarL family, nitrate/nitrite response regulator NarL